MKLIYLASTTPDLVWFRAYYRSAFPEGAANAGLRFIKTIDILRSNPYIGRPIGQDGLRKLSVPRTPFSIFYRLTEDHIEVVRIRDQRADPEKLEFHEEAAVIA